MWLKHHSRHSKAGALATREHLNLLINILASEQKCTQYIAQSGTDIAHSNAVKGVVDGKVAVHQIILILSIITYADISTKADCSLSRLCLTNKYAGKGGLTLAITAYKGNLVALMDSKLGTRKDSVATKGLANALNLGNNLT